MDAPRGGLEVAGFRATADGLAETDMRVAFFGDIFRPRGAMAGGGVPYTPADVKPGPERDLLAAFYQAAVEQDPSLGTPPGALGPGRVAAVPCQISRPAMVALTWAGLFGWQWGWHGICR